MDNYTKLANSILRESSPTFSLEIETEEEEIRSLDGFFSDEEAYVEDDEGLKKLGLTDDDINAVNVAKKLATKAGGAGAAMLTQNRMNAAYGDLMRKVAKKVSTVAKAIK
tara:strand:+ start:147 stop:476 length:330 start_codon:yes stop_codon:yes gene_type:complete